MVCREEREGSYIIIKLYFKRCQMHKRPNTVTKTPSKAKRTPNVITSDRKKENYHPH